MEYWNDVEVSEVLQSFSNTPLLQIPQKVLTVKKITCKSQLSSKEKKMKETGHSKVYFWCGRFFFSFRSVHPDV